MTYGSDFIERDWLGSRNPAAELNLILARVRENKIRSIDLELAAYCENSAALEYLRHSNQDIRNRKLGIIIDDHDEELLRWHWRLILFEESLLKRTIVIIWLQSTINALAFFENSLTTQNSSRLSLLKDTKRIVNKHHISLELIQIVTESLRDFYPPNSHDETAFTLSKMIADLTRLFVDLGEVRNSNSSLYAHRGLARFFENFRQLCQLHGLDSLLFLALTKKQIARQALEGQFNYE